MGTVGAAGGVGVGAQAVRVVPNPRSQVQTLRPVSLLGLRAWTFPSDVAHCVDMSVSPGIIPFEICESWLATLA